MRGVYFDYNNKPIPEEKREEYYENSWMSLQSMKDYEDSKKNTIKNNQKVSRIIQAKYTSLKESSKLINTLKRLGDIFNFT